MSIFRDIVKAYKGLSLVWRTIFFFASAFIIVYFIGCSTRGGDFVTFLEAATKMWQGHNIYDPPYINLRYSYSPFWAMVLVPFALLPTGVGAFIWLLISLVLLLRTFYILRAEFGIRLEDEKADKLQWFLIILFMSRFIELNFHHVQMTIFLQWLILESVLCADRGKQISAGILIGIGTIIKIMPVVMIPYFIYRRRFVAAMSALVACFAGFFAPLVFVGPDRFTELNTSWFSILRPDSPDFLADIIWHFPQNLSVFLYRLLMKTDAPYTTNIISLDYHSATIVVWIVIGLLVLLSLYFLCTTPLQIVNSRYHLLYEVSYLSLLIPLIFPHQMKYAFYFLLPAVSCIVCVLTHEYSKNNNIKYVATFCLMVMSFLLCTMTTDLLIGMRLSTITQHWKTITVGTLLLIPALALNRNYFVTRGESQQKSS